MEVGLMLNASPDDGEQPRPLLTWEATIRSRTPWDAGGYSLPVNHDLDTAISKHIHSHDSSLESSQTYPTKHSLSDSRGSLSSLASASTSTHSRFSSASTVGGFQAFTNFTDNPKLSDSSVDWTSILANSATLSPASPATFSFHHYPPSPRAEPIHVLAQIAERRYMDTDSHLEERYKDSEMADVDTRETSSASDKPALSRTASPTDALLIKRHTPLTPQESEAAGSVSAQPLHAGEENVAPWKYQPRAQLERLNSFPTSETRREFESHSGRFAIESRRHKRAFSEPQIQGQPGASFGQPTTDMLARYQRSEPTPPSSQHPENESPQAETLDASMHLGPQYTPPLQDQHSTCMFKEGCDTGSQPRKAVSHIFGRNKMCTRLIPEHVWVRYCRKHYQRSRYREPKNWPRCQCDLVQKQIQRLEEWSAENERRGEGGIVRSWGLAVRKREQKRLDDLALSKARGGRGNPYGGYEDADPSAPATAVPLWLRNLCGKTYSTLDIRDIFNRVHQELLNSPSPVFPDIEILPHITLDGDETESPMRYGARKTPTRHQRSRSMGGALPPPLDSFPEDLQFKSVSRSRSNSNFEHLDSPLQHKRKRRDYSPEDADAELTAQSQRLRLNVSTGAYESHPAILSASSSTSDIFQSHGPYRSPLPTPPSSTPSMQSLSSILASDGGGQASTRYPLRSTAHLAPDNGHRRSRSDLNGFPFPEQPPVSHMRSYSGAGMYQFPDTHGQSSQHHTSHGAQVAQRYTAAFPSRGGSGSGSGSRVGGGGHSRHQSTPVAPRLSLTPPEGMPPLPPSSSSRAEERFGGVLLPRVGVREAGERGEGEWEKRG
ncbi:hypothetical protein V494_04440 [Pseudogymnoascus sp. VKM F-4513 (FW-928)]|nr:hypothetical protein V494_04440 [Pseudogymnoascus sp. VKM F-4513 (FW-928)]